jgi:hypothetical protein
MLMACISYDRPMIGHFCLLSGYCSALRKYTVHGTLQCTRDAVGSGNNGLKLKPLFCFVGCILFYSTAETRVRLKKKSGYNSVQLSSKFQKSSLSRLVDFSHQQLPGYGLLSADNKIQPVKLRTLSRLAVFFF